MVTVPKSSSAAQDRYIYLEGLNHMTTNPFKLLKTNPVTSGLLSSILREPFQPKSKAKDER